jgi:formate/nitrite transporter FocA (FNT family)
MREEQAIREAGRLSPRMIYEVIRRDGEEELDRPTASLVWSGIAAGIMISFSVLGEAILRNALPDVSWLFLIENMGYSFGFLIVILGRMQLFTENTITTILPVAADPTLPNFAAVAKLWGIVLGANVFGALIAAAFMAHTDAVDADLTRIIAELSAHATGFEPVEAFARAIPAGILVAAIVWMMPGQNGSEIVLIALFTWLIAAGDFTHIIAGSVEMWFLMLVGELGLAPALFQFFLPVLAGNIVGGTAVFTLLAWGQVRAEVEPNAS